MVLAPSRRIGQCRDATRAPLMGSIRQAPGGDTLGAGSCRSCFQALNPGGSGAEPPMRMREGPGGRRIGADGSRKIGQSYGMKSSSSPIVFPLSSSIGFCTISTRGG